MRTKRSWPGTIDETELPAVAQVAVGIAEIDGGCRAPSLRLQAIGIDAAGQRFDERRLAVIDMARGADDHAASSLSSCTRRMRPRRRGYAGRSKACPHRCGRSPGSAGRGRRRPGGRAPWPGSRAQTTAAGSTGNAPEPIWPRTGSMATSAAGPQCRDERRQDAFGQRADLSAGRASAADRRQPLGQARRIGVEAQGRFQRGQAHLVERSARFIGLARCAGPDAGGRR